MQSDCAASGSTCFKTPFTLGALSHFGHESRDIAVLDILSSCCRLASHLVESVLRGAMKPVLEVKCYTVSSEESSLILFAVQCDYISEKFGADVSRVFRTLQKLR